MNENENVCLCFKVPLCKIRSYMDREQPEKASLISEVLGAGTGCHWCVPFLEDLHQQHQDGKTPDLDVSPEDYAEARKTYNKTGERPIEPGQD